MGKLGNPFCVGNAFDFDTCSSFTTYIYILPRCTNSCADISCASVDESDDVATFFNFVRIYKVGIGYGFNQGHPKSVGLIDAPVPDVGYLTAGVFFYAELHEPNGLFLQLNIAFYTQNGCTLKTGWNTAIEILLSDYMHFAYQIHLA